MRLVNRRKHVRTKTFYAIVDSGSNRCFFDAALLSPFRIRLEAGVKDTIGGIDRNKRLTVYYHYIEMLIVLDWTVGVLAGFSADLSATAILGRSGFFDSFVVTFDHSEHPPTMDIEFVKPSSVH